MDVASLIYNCLVDNLTSTIPITFKKDEFDPKNPSLQVLIETFPERSTWVTRGIYRVEQRIRISIYQKLIRYNPSNIPNYKTIWFSLKDNINSILTENKFNLVGIVNLDLVGGWDDEDTIAVGRGVKTVTEPIIWRSRQDINCVYYITKNLITE